MLRPALCLRQRSRQILCSMRALCRACTTLHARSTAALVTLMSGLPGSGKDTWLTQQRPELPVVSLDDLRGVLDVEPRTIRARSSSSPASDAGALRAGRHFAFNATNTMRQTRKRWIDLFAGYGARIELVYIEPPLSLIFERKLATSPAGPAAGDCAAGGQAGAADLDPKLIR